MAAPPIDPGDIAVPGDRRALTTWLHRLADPAEDRAALVAEVSQVFHIPNMLGTAAADALHLLGGDERVAGGAEMEGGVFVFGVVHADAKQVIEPILA